MLELLFEIGTEELPAGYILPALEALRESLTRLLAQERIAAERVWTAGTPRRLVVAAAGIQASQQPLREQVVGPPAKVAFDKEGKPTRAAEGFAQKLGLPVSSLSTIENPPGKGNGTYVATEVEHEGKPTADVLPGLLVQAALAIPFPKSMRWPMPAGPSDQRFARPVRWIVALLGSEVLPVRMMGLEAGNVTFGHPFLAPGPIKLKDASFPAYCDALRAAHVLVDLTERRKVVRTQVAALLAAHGSSELDEALLEEVTDLVEQPHAIEGSFDEAFLSVPECVVVAALTEHQRCFPVRDAQGALLPRFVAVTNRSPEQADTVRKGNQRVLAARLADGRFFWEEDRRHGLAPRVEGLEGVVYLGGLGNNLQRTGRLKELAGRIGRMMGMEGGELDQLQRAAHLCKADLLTGLVGEFPSLQGEVGRQLALAEGEPRAVADAIAEHYRPAGAGDAVPRSPISAALALADKLDVMAGCFALGLLPSGSQDPYALRRSALGVLLILAENSIALDLGDLVATASSVLEAQAPWGPKRQAGVPVDQIMDFFRDRLYHAALDRGFDHTLVRAALATGFSDSPCADALEGNVPGFWKRLEALTQCASRESWSRLTELVERTFRIQKDLTSAPGVREDLLKEKEELELARALVEARPKIEELFDQQCYIEAAELYTARLADPVHVFFDQVFVNVDDAELRASRKGLCAQVYHLFADRFADLCAQPE